MLFSTLVVETGLTTSETGNCQNGNEAIISKFIATVEQSTKKVSIPYFRRGKPGKNPSLKSNVH